MDNTGTPDEYEPHAPTAGTKLGIFVLVWWYCTCRNLFSGSKFTGKSQQLSYHILGAFCVYFLLFGYITCFAQESENDYTPYMSKQCTHLCMSERFYTKAQISFKLKFLKKKYSTSFQYYCTMHILTASETQCSQASQKILPPQVYVSACVRTIW